MSGFVSQIQPFTISVFTAMKWRTMRRTSLPDAISLWCAHARIPVSGVYILFELH